MKETSRKDEQEKVCTNLKGKVSTILEFKKYIYMYYLYISHFLLMIDCWLYTYKTILASQLFKTLFL